MLLLTFAAKNLVQNVYKSANKQKIVFNMDYHCCPLYHFITYGYQLKVVWVKGKKLPHATSLSPVVWTLLCKGEGIE